MKSVSKLHAAGFTVAPTSADVAVGCTLVAASLPFSYFNPRVASTAQEVFDNLTQAPERTPGVFGFVLAGVYEAEGSELPFEILLPEEREKLEKQHYLCVESEGEIFRLKQALEEAEMRAVDRETAFQAELRRIRMA